LGWFFFADKYFPFPAYGCMSDNSELYAKLNKAMNAESDWVIRMIYTDKSGVRTRRIVSPIKFIDRERMLALCLSRESPRHFELARCSDIELVDANDYVMPVPMEVIGG